MFSNLNFPKLSWSLREILRGAPVTIQCKMRTLLELAEYHLMEQVALEATHIRKNTLDFVILSTPDTAHLV